MAYIIFNLTLEESHSYTNFKAIVKGTNNVPCQRATAQRSLTQALDCTNKRKNHMRREAPIEIASYSTEWPALFAAEAAILKSALVTWLVGEPEHIGSTAVPGLAAKPVQIRPHQLFHVLIQPFQLLEIAFAPFSHQAYPFHGSNWIS